MQDSDSNPRVSNGIPARKELEGDLNSVRERPNEPGHPLALGLAVGAGLLVVVLAFRPIRDFFDLLFSGDMWTGLIGVGILVLLAGIIVLGLMGGRSDSLRKLGLLLMAMSPVCLIVGLIGTGWVVDSINWLSHAIPDIRDALSDS